jgi:integrase
MAQANAKADLERGVDPSNVSTAVDRGRTLEALARAWYQHNLPTWSAAHAADVLGSLERDVFAALGLRPIGVIEPPELLAVLRSIERRGHVITAQRLRQRLQEIFAFGVAEGLCSGNPAANLGAAMREAPPATPHPALTSIDDCRALLKECEGIPARPMTRLASRYLALTVVRLDSVRGMRWGELEGLDDVRPVWHVPPARLKLKRSKKDEERFAHLVPLVPAAVDVLRQAAGSLDWNQVESSALVFHGRFEDQPIGEGAIGELYKRTSFAGRHVPHGWRASFSTIMNETMGEPWRSAIDATLGHAKGDKVEAAYNRAQLLDRRREVLERWAELLVS